MTSRLMLLAGAAALVLASASAEPPHGDRCPPGQQRCADNDHQGDRGSQNRPDTSNRGPQGGPGAFQRGPQGGPDNSNRGPQNGPNNFNRGPQSGPGNLDKARHWQDDRGGWHRDHDRYWQPGRNDFAPRDAIFGDLRRHHFNRWDGDPYWFNGRFVIKAFDRGGRPVFVEINPYTGAFIGVVRF